MSEFSVSAGHRGKIKEEKTDTYLDLARELRKLRNMRITVIPVVNSTLGTVPKKAGRFGNKMTNRNHPNYCIVEISQNTEKSPGDPKRLDVI